MKSVLIWFVILFVSVCGVWGQPAVKIDAGTESLDVKTTFTEADKLYLSGEEPVKALQLYKTIIANDKDALYVKLSMFKTGIILDEQLMHYEEAIEAYQRFLNTYPQDRLTKVVWEKMNDLKVLQSEVGLDDYKEYKVIEKNYLRLMKAEAQKSEKKKSVKGYRTALMLLKKARKIYPDTYDDSAKGYEINYIQTCHAMCSLAIIKRLIKSVFVALILIVIALYIVTKPWEWFTMKQFIFVLLLFSGSAIMFLLINHVASKMVSPGSEYFPKPLFSNEQLKGFGGKISMPLMKFYMTGIISVIIAIIPLSRLRFTFTRTAMSLLLALIISSGIMGLFCFRQNEEGSHFSTFSFRSNKESSFPYMTGKWYWLAKDFKPYVISDPRNFMNLNIDTSNEPVFQEWMRDKYSKINSLNNGGSGAKK